jgi:hypothetical protein
LSLTDTSRATDASVDDVIGELRRRASLFPGSKAQDLDGWARMLARDTDIQLPASASLAPYLREALRKLADCIAAEPWRSAKDRFSFVRRATIGLVNDDKPNGWASGKTNGERGVCAAPRGRSAPVAPEVSEDAHVSEMRLTAEADASRARAEEERKKQAAWLAGEGKSRRQPAFTRPDGGRSEDERDAAQGGRK